MACLHSIWWTAASLPLLTSIVQHCHVWGSKNSQKSGWSLIHCCWITSVEQPTSPSTWLWTYFPGVSPITEDASVLLRTVAPSDCLFFLVHYKFAFTLRYITYYKLKCGAPKLGLYMCNFTGNVHLCHTLHFCFYCITFPWIKTRFTYFWIYFFKGAPPNRLVHTDIAKDGCIAVCKLE